MLESLLAAFGLNKASLLAGTLGALVAAAGGEGRTRAQRIVNFITGFCVAAWGAGLAITYVGIPPTPAVFGAVGFVFGYMGMSIMDAINGLDIKGLISGLLSKNARGKP